MGGAVGLAVLVGLGQPYVYYRLFHTTTTNRRLRIVGAVVLGVLGLLTATTIIASRVADPDWTQFVAWPGFLWLAVLFYLVPSLLLAEVPRAMWQRRQRPVDLERRRVIARGLALGTGLTAGAVVGFGAVQALRDPQIRRMTVPLAGLDPRLAGLRIAVLSDLHLGPIIQAGHTERIVGLTNEARPDLVAVVGDLANGSFGTFGSGIDPLRDLETRYGTFFVTGNHEYDDDPDRWIDGLERLGVRTLRNERTRIAGGLDLAGVTDHDAGDHGDAPDLERAIDGATGPVVLLAHQPVAVHEAARSGVGLQLSGHTHGGQMWPMHYLLRRGQPVLSGLHRIDGTWLYVSRGLANWGPPVRVGARPDIGIVELTPAIE